MARDEDDTPLDPVVSGHISCHCKHVADMVSDVRMMKKDMGRIEKLGWILVAGVAGILFAVIAPRVSHGAEPPPAGASERMGIDRVERPEGRADVQR